MSELKTREEMAERYFKKAFISNKTLADLLRRRDEMVVEWIASQLAAHRGSFVATDIVALKGKLK